MNSQTKTGLDIVQELLTIDYPKLPALALQATLLGHLRHVEKIILEGRIDSIAHVGIIAKSLERLCAQCFEGETEPRTDSTGDHVWKSEQFKLAMHGDIRDFVVQDAIEELLNIDLEERKAAAKEAERPSLAEMITAAQQQQQQQPAAESPATPTNRKPRGRRSTKAKPALA